MAARSPLPSSAASTMFWWQKEAGRMFTGLQLLYRSQLGYEGRRLEKECSRKCLEKFLQAGSVVDPFKPSSAKRSSGFLPFMESSDVFGRVQVISAGVQTFGTLLLKGTVPGSAGYSLSPTGEKIFPEPLKQFTEVNRQFLDSLSTLSNKISAGAAAGVFNPISLQDTRKSVQTAAATSPKTGLTAKEEEFLIKAAASVGHDASSLATQRNIYMPVLPHDYKVDTTVVDSLSQSSERAVPSSRIGRLASFGSLALGLSAGAAAELARRSLQPFSKPKERAVDAVLGPSNPFLTPANADRIVSTLCRVRGAALKLGQMLSIQDEEMVPAQLLQIFERVRHSADFMPKRQVDNQMREALGADWREKFREFEERPFAAASIGQVHRGVTLDGLRVAIKVQYPGVAEGIDSDIDNLVSVLSVGGLFPKGMFLDAFVKVARRELRQECDYEREARAMKAFRRLVGDSNDFYVPAVVENLSSKKVLVAELVESAKPVDQCMNEPQVVRDYIALKFIELCLKEIFVWRFMQTDPNWSNFLLGAHPRTGKACLVLLDFGASRAYPKVFVDKYMHIIRGAYDGDKEKILSYSRSIGFLTGFESRVMEEAHCESIAILSETLVSDKPYDFSKQDVTRRIHRLIPVMLEHRLTSPPEEIYSLHRKLSGSYLLATKLKAVVSCGPLFSDIYKDFVFGDDGKPSITID